MTDHGGDLTIGDGDYCNKCSMADALDCMAVGPCERRSLAIAIEHARRCLWTIDENTSHVAIRRSHLEALLKAATSPKKE